MAAKYEHTADKYVEAVKALKETNNILTLLMEGMSGECLAAVQTQYAVNRAIIAKAEA